MRRSSPRAGTVWRCAYFGWSGWARRWVRWSGFSRSTRSISQRCGASGRSTNRWTPALAYEAYEKVLELRPHDSDVIEALERLEREARSLGYTRL